MNTDLRITALHDAVAARDSGEGAADTVKRAQAFYDFFLPSESHVGPRVSVAMNIHPTTARIDDERNYAANREALIARASWWAGWCTDHDGELPDLATVSALLLEMKHRIALDGRERHEGGAE